jgi:alkaline phosphatase
MPDGSVADQLTMNGTVVPTSLPSFGRTTGVVTTGGVGSAAAAGAGNVRTAATIRVRRVSEATGGISTTGSWVLASNDGFLGDRARRSGEPGAILSYAFTGSQVAWYGTLAPSRGHAEVSIDGIPVATVDLHRATTSYRRVLFRHDWPSTGPHTIAIRVLGTAGHPLVDVDGFVVVDPPAVDPVLVGAGDIAVCGRTGDSRTAALLDGIAGRVFAAGDLAYPDGTTAQLRDCYGPTWGRWRLRTSPAVGNHEYRQSGAAPYFAFFGGRAGTAGQGWYAYDLGTWRVYSLNSNCTVVGCGATSAQVRWLAADLAANPRTCVAAVWHHPRFSSGEHGNSTAVATLWSTLEAAGAEVVLNGHDHDYERFAPQTASGTADADGMREFVVGTGGAEQRPFATIRANSVVRATSVYGVLALTLRPGGYDWRFVPAEGDTFTDTGSASCR